MACYSNTTEHTCRTCATPFSDNVGKLPKPSPKKKRGEHSNNAEKTNGKHGVFNTCFSSKSVRRVPWVQNADGAAGAEPKKHDRPSPGRWSSRVHHLHGRCGPLRVKCENYCLSTLLSWHMGTGGGHERRRHGRTGTHPSPVRAR